MKLFSPFELNGKRLRNRIVFPPITTSLASREFEITEKMIDYYSERARGGAALLIVEPGSVNPRGRMRTTGIGIHDDCFVGSLDRLAGSIKKHDALAFIQLAHSGPRAKAVPPDDRPLSASDVPVLKGVIPRPLKKGEIQAIVEEFVLAGQRAARAGFDGVEVHAGHFYLLSNFVSPLTNRRSDEYGGNTAGRAKMVCQIVRGIKDLCGPGFTVIVRYNNKEMGEGAMDVAEAAALGREFKAAGADALHLTSYYLPDPAMNNLLTIPATSTPGVDAPEGCSLEYTAAVKREVALPVIGVGKILSPEVAEQALQENKCDLVGIGRGIVADPDWPLKAAAGEEILRCKSCKLCMKSVTTGEIVCSVNSKLSRDRLK